MKLDSDFIQIIRGHELHYRNNVQFKIQDNKKGFFKVGSNDLVEFPKSSGSKINLCQVADELTRRVISLFEKDAEGNRRCYGKYNWFYKQPGNEHLVLFYEYFHGDTGTGLGASHQTGWTALVAELISEYGKSKTVNNKNNQPQFGNVSI